MPAKIPTVIRGVEYESMTAAAAALGLYGANAVFLAMENGTLDKCGLGRKGPRAIPFTYEGREFPSKSAAARHYGIKVQTFTQRLRKGQDPVNGPEAKPRKTPQRPKQHQSPARPPRQPFAGSPQALPAAASHRRAA